MKIIFLDIDGVLNVEVFINAFFAICKQMELNRTDAKILRKAVLRDDYGSLFCPTATNMLAWIVTQTDAKIVISSTWRHSGLEYMQGMWKHRGLPGDVINITPSFRNHRTDEQKKLDFEELAERGREIQYYIDNNNVESYIIIDDNNDMLPSQQNNFIQTDEHYGIIFKDAEKAILILNSQYTGA